VEIAEAQLAAIRAWRQQLGRCVFSAVVCPVLYLSQRVGGVGIPDFAFPCIILMSYTAEQTFHAWRQLRFARNLTEPLTIPEVRLYKAIEAWHHSIRDCLFGLALVIYIAVVVLSSHLRMLSLFLWLLITILLVLPGVRLTRSWRDLRGVNA
jgi:hypothetical protein